MNADRARKIETAKLLSVSPGQVVKRHKDRKIEAPLQTFITKPAPKFIHNRRDTYILSVFDRRDELRDNPTPSELAFMRRLKDLRITYTFQKVVEFTRGHCYVDFFIPELQLCIEVDGGYHRNKKQALKDKSKSLNLQKAGYSILRITNEDVDQMNDDILRGLLTNFKLGGTTWSPDYFNK